MDIGAAIGTIIGIPVTGFAVTAAVTVVALQIAIVVAIGGYLLGIPYSIAFRITKGRWPQYRG